MMELLGWIGNASLAVCGVPLAIKCLRTGTTSPTLDGLGLFLPLWVTGEFCTLAYVIYLGDYPLLLNYAANAVSLSVVIKYRFWPRRREGNVVVRGKFPRAIWNKPDK